MLIVGYPISYETACELFGVDQDNYGRILDSAVKNNGLEFHRIDKNLCILGFQVKEFEHFADPYKSVDKSIGIIMDYKIKFVEMIEKAGIDTSEILIERMEDEPVLVKNPPPYLITV